MKKEFDWIIFGAGIYGLYAARLLGRRGLKVGVCEVDPAPFSRASYVNQARVHNGYHYPRSYSTAKKSAGYFERFSGDFSFAINNRFKKIYALSHSYSLVNGEQFEKFCSHVGIPARRVNAGAYFRPGMVDAAFETLEYAFDACAIRDYFLEEIRALPGIHAAFSMRARGVDVRGGGYAVDFGGEVWCAPRVLNATYASVNQVNRLFGHEEFNLKYEICEIILCDVSGNFAQTGVTVLDGPFFSVMPFGTGSRHSLTAVSATPHKVVHGLLPEFSCQRENALCTAARLENCNACSARPRTAWRHMSQMAKKYLRPDVDIFYRESMFAIKPIPAASELDDSRPTIIHHLGREPDYFAVLSGKINTVYDLDKVLL